MEQKKNTNQTNSKANTEIVKQDNNSGNDVQLKPNEDIVAPNFQIANESYEHKVTNKKKLVENEK